MYVPPSWAMGALTRRDLDELPFHYYETLGGIYDSHAGVFHRLPMIGFEADTVLRVFLLNLTNAVNKTVVRALGRPLRVGLHPNDLELRMEYAVERFFQRPIEARSYEDYWGG
jgi:predicted deacetylase